MHQRLFRPWLVPQHRPHPPRDPRYLRLQPDTGRHRRSSLRPRVLLHDTRGAGPRTP
jgi:hypothetical protein